MFLVFAPKDFKIATVFRFDQLKFRAKKPINIKKIMEKIIKTPKSINCRIIWALINSPRILSGPPVIKKWGLFFSKFFIFWYKSSLEKNNWIEFGRNFFFKFFDLMIKNNHSRCFTIYNIYFFFCFKDSNNFKN